MIISDRMWISCDIICDIYCTIAWSRRRPHGWEFERTDWGHQYTAKKKKFDKNFHRACNIHATAAAAATTTANHSYNPLSQLLQMLTKMDGYYWMILKSYEFFDLLDSMRLSSCVQNKCNFYFYFLSPIFLLQKKRIPNNAKKSSV